MVYTRFKIFRLCSEERASTKQWSKLLHNVHINLKVHALHILCSILAYFCIYMQRRHTHEAAEYFIYLHIICIFYHSNNITVSYLPICAYLFFAYFSNTAFLFAFLAFLHVFLNCGFVQQMHIYACHSNICPNFGIFNGPTKNSISLQSWTRRRRGFSA